MTKKDDRIDTEAGAYLLFYVAGLLSILSNERRAMILNSLRVMIIEVEEEVRRGKS